MKIPYKLCLTALAFSLFGCDHPDSKDFERNKKSSHKNFEKSSEISNVYSNIEVAENPRTENISTQEVEQNVLPMEVQNGVRYVWIEVNGIKLKFIFDTGASNICISPAEAMVLYKQGTLTKEDILDTEYFQDATGKISEGTKVNLREVKISNIVLTNVEATIIDNVDAPLLLGQSVFERFGKIEIDNRNNQIILK